MNGKGTKEIYPKHTFRKLDVEKDKIRWCKLTEENDKWNDVNP